MEKQLFTFCTAETVLFGNNALEELGNILEESKVKRILVITDKDITQSGFIERLKVQLKNSEYSVYDEIEATPSLETIRKCTGYAREGRFDLLIGFGGGSPMDAAKAVSVMMTNEGDIEEYLGRDTVGVPGVKKILITTTAGTGSEVTIYSVLATRGSDNQAITGIADKHLLPEWAIIDPTLTLSMPPSLTANTGIDALSHAIESYLNIKSNFQTEPLALNAIRLLSHNIEKATAKGDDLEARYHVSAGSILAGMSLSQTGGGLAHALAETIQIPYSIQHGTAIASVLPHVMSYNMVTEPSKYAAVAMAMGAESKGLSETELAKDSVKRISRIIDQVGLPVGLSKFNISETDLEKIAESTAILASGLLKVNPRPADVQDLLELLRKAY